MDDLKKIIISCITAIVIGGIVSISASTISNTKQDEKIEALKNEIANIDKSYNDVARLHDLENAKLILRLEIQKSCNVIGK